MCILPAAALRDVERETGSRPRRWSYPLILLDRRYRNLWVAPGATILVVPGPEIEAADFELVCEPDNHYGICERKIVYAHRWAHVCDLPADCANIEIRHLDCTCEPPAA